ncbi:hypothetical protein [Bradyrhizobium sp. MOS003]|uniref:hypothetical protein n=1 Tax=Bradyrhizobium sp. MOS003 TaxID=2133946 RepID=UPI001FE15DD9|nr:hypothetical protein [Bradyrhizobium sp. MOS003]
MIGAYVARIGAGGRLSGNQIRLDGNADTMRGGNFWVILMRLDDGAMAPSTANASIFGCH